MNTHEVFNHAQGLSGVNLYRANRPLRDALARYAPGLDTTQRRAFGKALIDPPLMKNVLADLALEHDLDSLIRRAMPSETP